MNPNLICLEGTPAAVGRTFGALNASDISEAVRNFYKTAKKAERLSAQDLVRAGRHYVTLVKRYAPHWIPEAEAIAAAAGVDAELYITYQGAKYRGINRPECFSYFSPPHCNWTKATLLHKNRDNVARPQCAYVKAIKLPRRRVFRFMANGDDSDMGLMMALNEKGLAIVADFGYPDPHSRQRGMMNTDIMRLIVEQASDVREALELLYAFHKDRIYAGGKHSTHWMLADRHGKGLRVYQFHEKIVVKESARGFLVMRDDDARGTHVMGALSRQRGRITGTLMNQVSRQSPVLAASNVSAYTAVIPPTQTDLFSYAWFAVNHAGKVLYVPLYMGVTATPRALVSGALFRLANAQRFGVNLFAESKQRGVNLDEFEQEMQADRANMEIVARQALRREGRASAQRVLTEGCLRFAARVERTLRLLGASCSSSSSSS